MDSLITCCASAGVAEWVCCPGEWNAPLLKALARCPQIHRWQHQDDRSAGYFALGRIQATARAVAVVAGSGAAAASLLSAVIEAYYERRPLIVVTVDGDPAPGGDSGSYGQIEQNSLYGIYAPTVDIHVPCSVAELPDMIELCAEGFPVHIRLFCAEGARIGRSEMLTVADPPAAPRFRGSLAELSQMLRFRAHEGLALLLGALDPDEQEPALWLARTLRVPVLADATSGLREKLAPYLLHGGDDILIDNPPRYVLRLGGVPSGAFWRALEEMPDTEVYSITRTGFAGLHRQSYVIEGEPEQVMKALGDIPHVGDTMGYMPQGRRYAGRMEELLMSEPESDAALIRAFSQHACLADVLFLGSPTATTLWNTFAQLQLPTLYTRSVSQAGGIDGAISAFLGNAVDAGFACALVGDIAMLRDMAAATLLSQLPPGKRIIAVLNNDGAGAALPAETDDELRRFIAQPPELELQEIARLYRAEYYLIRSEADFEIIEGLEDDCLVLLDIQAETTAEY